VTGAADDPALSEEARSALAKLEELDRVLPRGIEDWVAERDREGLHVPDILKRRLAEKARLRAIFREGGDA
jgi:hypothetical protein